MTTWLECFRPNPRARLRLFCLPYAGAGASLYRSWWRDLPDEIEVWAFQLPGRERRLREPRLTELSPVLEGAGDALAMRLELPFALFGHSFGAMLSFELTRYLRRRFGVTPKHLFVSGYSAPHLPLPNRWTPLSDEQFITKMRDLQGTPEEVLQHPELMQLFLPLLRADLELLEAYRHQTEPPLECSITAFGGAADPEVACATVEQWRWHTTGAFNCHILAGDHFFFQNRSRGEFMALMADELSRILDSLGVSSPENDTAEPSQV